MITKAVTFCLQILLALDMPLQRGNVSVDYMAGQAAVHLPSAYYTLHGYQVQLCAALCSQY